MSPFDSKSCIITNPSARGDKARSFLEQRKSWEEVGVIMETSGPGDAERLAALAVKQGFTTVIAGGGDGTVFEVLNGLVSGNERLIDYRFGVLPLGTVNVFAKELGMPMNPKLCKDVLLKGSCRNINLPVVDFQKNHLVERRYFVQLGGAGLDAAAINEVSFKLKKKVGPLAYIAAGLKVLNNKLPKILCKTSHGVSAEGKLVLIGNGAFYGGKFRVFPDATLDDGLIHALVIEDIRWLQLPRRGLGLWLNRLHTQPGITYLKSISLELVSKDSSYFELEGEVVGHLPARFTMSSDKLQVIAPT